MEIQNAVRRIKYELREERREESINDVKSGITFYPVDSTFTVLHGRIPGPRETPYEGGTFFIEIEIKNNYPFSPPHLRFITKIWHPNVDSETGETWTHVEGWAAGMTLKSLLILVESLLCSPDSGYKVYKFVNKQYSEDPRLFELTARYWAKVYAGAQGSFELFDEKMRTLTELGVEADRARWALSTCSWDVEDAMDLLMLRTYKLENAADEDSVISDVTSKQQITEEQMDQKSSDAEMAIGGQDIRSSVNRDRLQASGSNLRAPHNSEDDKIKLLVNIGTNEAKAREALSLCLWNLEEAADLLFGAPSQLHDSQQLVVDQKSTENQIRQRNETPELTPRPLSIFDQKIKYLMDRGIDEARALKVLTKCYWNLKKAENMLFGNEENTKQLN